MMLNGWLKNTTDMETKFNFKSQVCTDRFQSERLLALGLKPETADMVHCIKTRNHLGDEIERHSYYSFGTEVDERPLGYANYEHFPAWSLHRLWCLLPRYITIVNGRQYKAGLDLTMDSYQNVCYLEGADEPCYDMSFFANDAYESICKAIEWLIKEGYFNKEYLV